MRQSAKSAAVCLNSVSAAVSSVTAEPLSLRERMSRVLSMVTTEQFTLFTDLFDIAEGRQGVVVTFMAILELIKQQLVELVQAESFAPIHVRGRGG